MDDVTAALHDLDVDFMLALIWLHPLGVTTCP